jgi:hypothetical protein
VGHLAGREGDQRPTVLQPEVRLSKACPAPSGSRSIDKGINKKTSIVELGNRGEQVISQYAHIGSDTAKNCGQQQAIENTVRMIGRNEQTSPLRDARNVEIVDERLDAQHVERPAFELTLRSGARLLVKASAGPEAQYPRQDGPRGRAGEVGFQQGLEVNGKNGHLGLSPF